MRAAGIICEYNPFHSGHKKQIDFLRGLGYDCIISVMSGNFTERGEAAIYDKYTRAKAAVASGVDLVLELPYPYSSLSAEGFARSGISIISRLSGVETVSFGHECEDPRDLFFAAERIESEEFAAIYAETAKKGNGARAFFDALASLGCKTQFGSNDILGIAYIKALRDTARTTGAQIEVVPIKRHGTLYRSEVITDEFNPSASGLRKLISESNIDLITENMLPKSAQKVYISETIDAKNDSKAIICDTIRGLDFMLPFFKFNSPELIRLRAREISGGGSDIAFDGCGILDRLCRAANAPTLAECLEKSYIPTYTHARVRRVMLAAYLGVSDERAGTLPEYTTLLAANGTGRKFMASTRKTRQIPIVTKPADAPAGVQRNIITLSDSVYALAMAKSSGIAVAGDYFTKCRPYMVEDTEQ